VTTREHIIAEAQSWRRTPYHHRARVKGAGADCVTFLAAVYEAVGLLPHIEFPYYPPDWNLHRDEERYLLGLLDYAVLVSETLPGDVVMFQMGRTISHGGIWVGPDRFIHCWNPGGVEEMQMDAYWWPRYRGTYRLKGL
jgi:NlpC/P60 family putative phage cell wall peptidase